MRRRDALKTLALLPLASAAKADGQPSRQPLGLVIHSYAVRGSKPLSPDFPPISDPLAFVEHAAAVGAAGVQTRIGIHEPAALDRLREAVAMRGMYLEGTVTLVKEIGRAHV